MIHDLTFLAIRTAVLAAALFVLAWVVSF